MDEKELQMRFQIFEQQIMQIQQQIQAIDQATVEIDLLEKGLNDLSGKKDSEILAPLGKGIFAKAKLISEDLMVDVGGKNLIIKSIPETQELIKVQLTKLQEVKVQLEEELEKINMELTKTMFNFNQDGNSQCGCGSEGECEKDCDCDDDCKHDCESHDGCKCEKN